MLVRVHAPSMGACDNLACTVQGALFVIELRLPTCSSATCARVIAWSCRSEVSGTEDPVNDQLSLG